jgi:hypothetical protein
MSRAELRRQSLIDAAAAGFNSVVGLLGQALGKSTPGGIEAVTPFAMESSVLTPMC